MNRRLTTIRSNVASMVQDTSAPMLALIQNYINDRYREVKQRLAIVDIQRSDYTFTTTAGTEDYVLPMDFWREYSVLDKTNKRQLSRIDTQQVVDNYSWAPDQQGITTHYQVLDKTCNKQPTSASVISVSSSSASDTSQTVFIKGLDTNGYEDYETISLNGTNVITSTKTYTQILMISKSGVTAGTVTLTSNSGAVTNAVISRQMLDYRVKILRLVQIPNGSWTIEINYQQRENELNQDGDYPVVDCYDILEAGATADALRYKRQYAKAADWDVIFEKRLNNLAYAYEASPNKVNVFNPRTYRAFENGNVDDARRYGVF